MFVSPNLRYHIAYCRTPNLVWIALGSLFGKIDKMKNFRLENEAISRDPIHCDNIEDFFTKLNSLRLQLEEWGWLQ